METLQRTANRGSISTGYDIEYSNKFESDAGEGIIRNYDASTGANCIANNSTTNAKKFTVSYWVKKTELLASGQNIPWIAIAGGNATVVKFQDEKFAAYDDSAGWSLATNALFRDTSAWYHLVCAVDTTQSTASDRVNLYVNGVLQTSFSTENYGTQNNDNQLWKVNTGHQIGNAAYFKGGYIAELHCIDGTQYAASDFGEYDDDSGIWIPKEADVTYGDQGYYLNWSDFGSANSNANNTGVGKDFSGNTNPFNNLGNWSSADIATDTPTNNFCTLNPLALDGSVGSSGNITQGATKATATEFDVFITFAPTFGVTSGKWYAEFEYEGSQADNLVGILDIDAVVPYNSRLGKAGAWSVGFYQANGKLYVTADSGVTSIANWGASATNGDIISVAVDMDNYFVYFAKNGTWQNSGVPTSGATGTGGVAFDSNKTVGIGCSSYDQGGDEGQIFSNYGGYTAGTISSGNTDSSGYGNFEFAPPSGYYALCTKNLAEYG